MSVLLLRLAGPMQSWGIQSRFSIRDTGREPSKSGVVGLLCAALGRPRSDSLADLAALKMGVRVDAEGRLAKDYHTALNVAKSGGGTKECEPSTRYYLADAAFLVGLESPDVALLKRLDDALRSPHWPLSLGRKSFLPGEPVPLEDQSLAIQDGELFEVLKRFPRKSKDPHRFVLEVLYDYSEKGVAVEPRPDQPVSFESREFHLRHVAVKFDPPPTTQRGV